MMIELGPGDYLLEVDRGEGFIEDVVGSLNECKRVYYRNWRGYAARVLDRHGRTIMEAEPDPEQRKQQHGDN